MTPSAADGSAPRAAVRPGSELYGWTVFAAVALVGWEIAARVYGEPYLLPACSCRCACAIGGGGSGHGAGGCIASARARPGPPSTSRASAVTSRARCRVAWRSGGPSRALTLAPEVLLLDEPFGALDEITRDRMNRGLLGLFEGTGLTVVFVTHSIEEAVFLSDRVVVMSRGRSRHTGTSIARVVDVDLPRPRDLALKETVAFFELVRAGREALRQA